MPSKAVVAGRVIPLVVLAMCGFYIGSKLSSLIRYSMIAPFSQGSISPPVMLFMIGMVSLVVGVLLIILVMRRLIRSASIWGTIGLIVVSTTLLTLSLNALADAAIWSSPTLG